MSKIKKVTAREILDSRGWPTVETEVILKNGKKAWAGVPSGASTGRHEAWELRDKESKRYSGKGCQKAVTNVNKVIYPKVKNLNPQNQKKIDDLMIKLDGTGNKKKLGANAILSVSLAVARAAALDNKLPLYKYLRQKYFRKITNWQMPKPMMNIINGGVHADFAFDFQEFMIIPQQRKSAEAVRCGAEVFHALGKILKSKSYDLSKGDEGGYCPKLKDNMEAFEIILEAIKKAGYSKENVKLAIDAASSEFYNKKQKLYIFKRTNTKLTRKQLIDYYDKLINKYPIISIEDGLHEDDWLGWQEINQKFSRKIMLIGDDLFVTNKKRLEKGVEGKAANAILIKLNQIGTLSETINCIQYAKDKKYQTIISHRSGETADDFIVDLAVAAGAGYLKAGSLARGERVVKYNRLMEIASEIN